MRALPWLIALLLCTACIPRRVDWRAVDARADHSTLRHTPAGDVIGFVEQDGTLSWVGIPYAKALRWKAPRPFGRVDPIMFSATRYGPECPQLDAHGAFTGDENCLTLNVSARSIDDAKRPVLVWVHDGSNGTGTANEWSVMRRVSARYGVVMVAVNYRLGVLGTFRKPPGATDDTPADASGNYGTLDVIEALKWVRANIGAFGGDPDDVLLFGGSEMFALLASPLATGLFQRAAIVDGLPGSVTPAEAEALITGRAPNAAPASLEVEQLVTTLRGASPPIRDGHVLPSEPLPTALSNGVRPPVLLGTSRHGEDFERAFRHELGVNVPADALLQAGTPVFLFSFPGADVASLVLGDEREEEPARVRQSRAAMSYWVKFALSGAPSKGMNDEWPAWPPAPNVQRLDAPRSTEGRETLDALEERLWRAPEFPSDAARCEAAHELFEVLGTASGVFTPARAARIAEHCSRGN